MLAVKLPEDIEARLASLAKKTGRTKTFYVREAVLEHLEDLEDHYLAAERAKKNLPAIPLEEVERGLGLAD
jgi:RHH-type rel operon transcriptional repressor/antitoxin RelB